MVLFRLLGPSKASYSEIIFGRSLTVKTRKGDKDYNFAAASRDLLHFNLELTQIY